MAESEFKEEQSGKNQLAGPLMPVDVDVSEIQQPKKSKIEFFMICLLATWFVTILALFLYGFIEKPKKNNLQMIFLVLGHTFILSVINTIILWFIEPPFNLRNVGILIIINVITSVSLWIYFKKIIFKHKKYDYPGLNVVIQIITIISAPLIFNLIPKK